MITEAGLAVYRSFNGDGDGFARAGTVAQKAQLSGTEWGLVESFLQDLYLVQQGLVSAEYAVGVQHRLAHQCSSPEVIASLEAMAQAKKPERFIPRVLGKVRTWLGT
jgi:hypothetical protein